VKLCDCRYYIHPSGGRDEKCSSLTWRSVDHITCKAYRGNGVDDEVLEENRIDILWNVDWKGNLHCQVSKFWGRSIVV